MEKKRGESKRAIGDRYEEMAADYLISRGYQILKRNYYGKHGEIDIIARSPEGFLVFAEVKYRTSDQHGHALEMVTPQKIRRICRTAAEYMRKELRSVDLPCRFDVIGIQKETICHVPAAFDYCFR